MKGNDLMKWLLIAGAATWSTVTCRLKGCWVERPPSLLCRLLARLFPRRWLWSLPPLDQRTLWT